MKPRFSFVTPVYNPPSDVLTEMIESVIAQRFTDWELILVDDKSPSQRVTEILRSFAELDDRIVVAVRTENGGIVAASNDGLALATGEFVGLLDHDDTLVPDALHLVDMYARRHPEMDYCYSDEDLLAPDGQYIGPFYKPDWSPERLRGQNYCTHFSVFRATLLDEIGGFRPGFDGSQDYDIILRASEVAREIVHIPFVLYHWRQIESSVAMGDPSVKPYAYDAGRRAVAEHCVRVGIDAAVELGHVPGNYQVRRNIPDDASISVAIATKGDAGRVWGIERRHVVETVCSVVASSSRQFEFVVVTSIETPDGVRESIIRAAGDHPVSIIEFDGSYDRSTMTNEGAAHSAGEFILFLHDDIEVITPEIIDELLPFAADERVGAVGCKSLSSDGRIRHGGYVFNGNPNPIMQGYAGDHPGHRGMLTVPREVAGVSGACTMMRRSVFFDVGGLCRHLACNFSDVDLSLKLRAVELDRIWTPHAEIYDFGDDVDPAAPSEEREFISERWGHQLVDDPYFNPNLQPDRRDWVEKGLR